MELTVNYVKLFKQFDSNSLQIRAETRTDYTQQRKDKRGERAAAEKKGEAGGEGQPRSSSSSPLLLLSSPLSHLLSLNYLNTRAFSFSHQQLPPGRGELP
jgi:hypothetical protein